MAHMPATSNEDVEVFWGAAVAAADPPVQIAIIPWASPENEPADADYIAAAWMVETPGYAGLHIGLGTDHVYEAGEYVIWTRVTAGNRRPVRRSGLLTIGVLP